MTRPLPPDARDYLIAYAGALLGASGGTLITVVWGWLASCVLMLLYLYAVVLYARRAGRAKRAQR